MAEKVRDSQRQKVYDWERSNVAPHDVNYIPLAQVQSIIDYVWAAEGLLYPPRAELLPKQIKKAAGDATRTCVRFRESTNTWIVLHELSHSMTSTVDNVSNQHGALFMGIYIQLLTRYLKLPFGELMESAEAAGLKVKADAKPVFL
jgi:hypothetical protein